MNKRLFITGSAGFIGFHVSRYLLTDGYSVVSIDNLNDYYDVSLKEDRLSILKQWDNFHFYKVDLADREGLKNVFAKENITAQDRIIHLAAQAGVRYSRKNPDAYMRGNIMGTYHLLELASQVGCEHFLYASSSSVYGGNQKYPFSVSDNVDHPISLYAATKKTTELLAHIYSYNYDLPTTGLRLFTVYGPWGRPDMALFIFTKAIIAGKPIPVFNNGDMYRDFTYIDDVVEGVVRLVDHIPQPDPQWEAEHPDPATSWLPYRVYNIGHNEPVYLMDFIRELENHLGKRAEINFLPMEPGDVKKTYADIDALVEAVDYRPTTPIQEGIPRFLEWYRQYYNVV